MGDQLRKVSVQFDREYNIFVHYPTQFSVFIYFIGSESYPN